MQRYHDPSTDPLPIKSPYHEAERQRLEQKVSEFLAKGGEIQQIGHQMRDKYVFVISPSKSPVYAHLFEQPAAPEATAAKPVTARAEPEQAEPVELLTADRLAARLMVQAALGASPAAAARAVGITEKHARQIARDYSIKFQRQR
ncbi:hypothetical protein D9M69_397380 [compost metagenome]